MSNITPNQREAIAAIDDLSGDTFYVGGSAADKSINVNITGDIVVGDINLAKVGGASIALGQTTMSASLPVAIASNQSVLSVSQSGTWNITNISGTISLPTGAATSSNQTSGAQKSQIVDSGGNVVGATANALDINIKSGNITGFATSANQTNGNQQSKITNGTNIADVIANDTGYNGLVVNAGAKVLGTFNSTGTGAQILAADTDVRGYASIGVIWTSVGSGLTLTGGQFASTSGGTYTTAATWLNPSSATTFPAALGVTVNTLYRSTRYNSFFRINISALTSGTATAIIVGFTDPLSFNITRTGGTLTNNDAAPTGNNVGSIPGIANAAQPSWSEGFAVLESMDLKGNQRIRIQDAAGNDRGANVDTNNNLQVGQATAANLNATVVGTGTFATQVTANPLVSSPLVGQSKVAVTGTAVRLNGGTSQPLTNGIIISAPAGNTGPISIGTSSVNNTQDGTGNGYLLAAGASISFAVNNTNDIYINGLSGDYVSWAGS